MSTPKLLGIAALFFAFEGAAPAQNTTSPGELTASSTTLIRLSSFDSTGATMAINPKRLMADVEARHQQRLQAIWVASIAVMLAGTTADAVSSWHRQESNRILASPNGTFGGRGTALKAGIALGVIMPQIIFRKRREWRAAFAVGNFAEAGIFTGAAIHNSRLGNTTP